METLKFFTPLATVVICFVALFTGQALIFNWLLSPVKETQARMEMRMDMRMDKIEMRMDKIEMRIDKIDSKLDQIIMSQFPKQALKK